MLTQARTHDLALTVTPVDSGLQLVDVFDVQFEGVGGHPIKAWLTRPTAGATVAVCPHEHVDWAAAGLCTRS
ncbi:MAG TPA: acetylxylan esterase [Dermatophilaceae bacterium]|jgi:cephalosporin-C deacetylase